MVNLDIAETSYLIGLLAPIVVDAEGTDKFVVELFSKLSHAFTELHLMLEDTEMDKAAHIPDRASGSPKGRDMYGEPETKIPMKSKTVTEVYGEAPHVPAPRDSETAIKKSQTNPTVKGNAGS